MTSKYKINDYIRKTHANGYIEFGLIWNIKENSYIVKWLGRAALDHIWWGSYCSITETDSDSNIRISSNNEYILFGVSR